MLMLKTANFASERCKNRTARTEHVKTKWLQSWLCSKKLCHKPVLSQFCRKYPTHPGRAVSCIGDPAGMRIPGSYNTHNSPRHGYEIYIFLTPDGL